MYTSLLLAAVLSPGYNPVIITDPVTSSPTTISYPVYRAMVRYGAPIPPSAVIVSTKGVILGTPGQLQSSSGKVGLPAASAPTISQPVVTAQRVTIGGAPAPFTTVTPAPAFLPTFGSFGGGFGGARCVGGG